MHWQLAIQPPPPSLLLDSTPLASTLLPSLISRSTRALPSSPSQTHSSLAQRCSIDPVSSRQRQLSKVETLRAFTIREAIAGGVQEDHSEDGYVHEKAHHAPELSKCALAERVRRARF